MSLVVTSAVNTPPETETATPLSIKLLIAALVVLLLLLVYRLIFGDGSVQEVWRLNQIAEEQREEIEVLRSRNQTLQAEVDDLKKGLQAVEERARAELGMVRDGEVFYQFIDRDNSSGLTPRQDRAQPSVPASSQ